MSARPAVPLAVATMSLALVFPVDVVQAGSPGADIAVTTFEDELFVDGDCSLREAVIASNTDAPVDACPAGGADDLILLSVGTYRLTIAGAGEDAGLSGDLDILGSTSIDVAGFGGDGRATIDAEGTDRILDYHLGARIWSLRSVNLVNGDAGVADGGAIRVNDGVCDANGFADGFFDLESLRLESNWAAHGGALHIGACRQSTLGYASVIGNHAAETGGGINLADTVWTNVFNTTVSGNSAGAAGGGLWTDSPGSIDFATFANNAAPAGAGVWTAIDGASSNASIVAMNDGPNCGFSGEWSLGALADDETCGIPVEDAGLLPLTRVGDSAVHRLADDSVAIDLAGAPIEGAWCSPLSASDQVGTIRPLDGDGDGFAACDYGAVEHASAPLVPEPSSPPAQPSSPPALPDTALSHPVQPVGSVAAVVAVLIASCAWFVRRPTVTRPMGSSDRG